MQAAELMGLIGGMATIFAVLLAPYFWLASKIDNISSNLKEDMNEFRKEMNEFRNEIKYFHARLYVLEDRYLQIITKKG